MKSLSKLLMIAPIILMTSAIMPASAFQVCDSYASTAVFQQSKNFQNQCGLEGLKWHSNYNAHKAYCQTMGIEISQLGTNDRAAELNQCFARNNVQNRFPNNEHIIPVNQQNRFGNNEILVPIRNN